MNDLELLGGDAALEKIMDDFVDRCFSDVMIGFFFRRANRERIKRLERELAADHLGLGRPYTGRPMREAHARHPILGAHFSRRIQILKETLADHHVPEDVQERWLAHDESLRDQVTARPGSNCNDLVAHSEREER